MRNPTSTPRLTVIYCSARPGKSFVHHPEWNHFAVLGRCLDQQTYRDFDLVVVTPFIDEAINCISVGESTTTTIVKPRATPWNEARMFAAASARNTALSWARGEWVVVLDDCVTFPPDFLARIASWTERGMGVAIMYNLENGEVNDTRWGWFNDVAKDRDHVIIRGADQPYPQGCVVAPMDTVLGINGYDELRFDGARGLEDVNFSRRLQWAGVPFVMDRHILLTLHAHQAYPDGIISLDDQVARCCNVAHVMALRDQSIAANRVRLTDEQKRDTLHCMFWRDDGKCGYYAYARECAYQKWASSGHPVATRIIEHDEEQLFDLVAARHANGL